MKLISVHEQCVDRPIEAEFLSFLDGASLYRRTAPGGDQGDSFCYSIEKKDDSFKLSSSYFIGVDWISPGLAIQVKPKTEYESVSIDYIRMLVEALEVPENAKHLDGLVTIDFNASPISLEQNEDILSPFLIAQFLATLRVAAVKGLRKSYYQVDENLRSKVKGKILVEQNIRVNLSHHNQLDNVCCYQEYGVNTEENKILKRALSLSSRILSSYRGGLNTAPLRRTIAFLKPYFRDVDDDYDISRVGLFKSNPIYREYSKALEYAILIIKRRSYGMGLKSDSMTSTPPYWIDMSKLFELYVLKQLRIVYGQQIEYQVNLSGRFPDYILYPDQETEPYIIDAKYKFGYKDGFSGYIEDIRQVSAYARMKALFKKLGPSYSGQIINCLIIYPELSAPLSLENRRDIEDFTPSNNYVGIYKVGIGIPLLK